MRYLWIVISASTLMGCASTGKEHSSLWKKLWHKDHKEEVTTDKAPNNSTLPDVDLSK
mgnify:FL=1